MSRKGRTGGGGWVGVPKGCKDMAVTGLGREKWQLRGVPVHISPLIPSTPQRRRVDCFLQRHSDTVLSFHCAAQAKYTLHTLYVS